MTDVTSGSGAMRLRHSDRVYVGWRYAQVHPEPGPPPRRPNPPEAVRISQEWLAEQRREENLLNRPLKIAAACTGVGVLVFLATWAFGILPGMFAVVGLIACLFVFLITGSGIWQGEQALRSRVDEEQARLDREREARLRRLNSEHAAHEKAYREWERRRAAYDNQQEWYPVPLPPGVDRVDVAGGTLAGWSAMVTMMGGSRLAAGSQVTVLDLSEGAVARDLVQVAADRGAEPLVWVLPADLPRLDLTSDLSAESLADVLSLVVSVSEEQSSTRDLSFDNALLERVLSVFAGRATIRQITAALRALAQVGDPRDDLRMGLISDDQLDRLTTMFGRGAADRVVIERAWALESQLRKLETLGTDVGWVPPSRLRVVTMDRRAGVLTNRVLGTYVTAALTHRLRETEQTARPWDHTLFVCGGEKLRGDVLDRLIDACEATGTGLVLMYRSVPPHVKERLGRGHAAVGFMRLGNAEDARTAAQHIGTRHRLTVAELTDSVGDAVADSLGEPYTSTVNAARTRLSAQALDSDWAPGMPDGAALVAAIATSTGWGQTVRAARSDAGETAADAAEEPAVIDAERTGAADTGDDAEAASRQTVREFVVERHQLQQLPPTAMIFTHAMATGRQILLVDANPAIMTLPTAHSQAYEEFLREQEAAATAEAAARPAVGARREAGRPENGTRSGGMPPDVGRENGPDPVPKAEERGPAVRVGRHAAPPGTRARSRHAAPPLGAAPAPDDPPADPDREANSGPNLGPPPERLDFRRKKKR
ncbi:MAG TPA: hypothetical protein VFU43_07900 [Streptosporangiaceae bacterium]|nr:hypothetical protein [Streptosporangiaceae bacterium]